MASWQTYREALTEAFEEKRARRPAYSLRAFARDIHLTASHLVDVMTKRRGLSPEKATRIASVLFDHDETAVERFVSLVEVEHARRASDRDLAKLRLDRLEQSVSVELKGRDLEFLRSWVLPAALELISIKRGALTAEALSAALEISPAEAENALSQLAELGFIRQTDGQWLRVRDYVHVHTEDSVAVLRSFHKDVLSLIAKRIEETATSERLTHSSVISIDHERLEEARAFLKKSQDEFFRRFATTRNANAVFVYAHHLVRADIGEDLK